MLGRERQNNEQRNSKNFAVFLAIVLLPLWPIIIPLGYILEYLFNKKNRVKEREVRQHVLRTEAAYRQHRRFFEESAINAASFWLCDIEYRKVQIAKATGGMRTLSIPSDELKYLQASFTNYIQKSLQSEVHKCANAFVPGRSTLTNAKPHLGCDVLIKMDIVKFFDSVDHEQIKPWVSQVVREPELVDRVLEIVCGEQGLPQGAPSSPLLSNLVLRDLDIQLYQECNRLGAIYTRYADDITISLGEDDPALVRYLIKIVEDLLSDEGFKLNKKKGKLHVLRPHQAQRICGVTINSGHPTISRKQRRLLRAAKHRKMVGGEATLTEQQMAGWDSYIQMVMGEPALHLNASVG